MGDRIWLIGGTTESVQLACAIASLSLPCTVTVATRAAEALYPKLSILRIQVGRLDINQLGQFLQEQQIAAILDASHPYAVEISQMAIRAASHHNIPYMRFERPDVAPPTQYCSVKEGCLSRGAGEAEEAGEAGGEKTGLAEQYCPPTNTQQIITLDSFETLLASDYLYQQRVLLTIGYKALHLFKSWQDKSTLFARILPAVTSLEAAISAGFSADRIVALRPPASAELEKALWRHWDISLVVTKASGVAGGEDVKRTIAAQLGIPLIIIARPSVSYPQQTSDLSAALQFCQKYLVPRTVSINQA